MSTFGMSEEFLPVVVPVLVYWIGAAVYHLTLWPKERRYHLFTKEEEEAQNIATRRQVLTGVLANQVMQMGVATLAFKSGFMEPAGAAAQRPFSLLRVAGQMALGLLIMDAWEYFWHRLTHEYKFMYKHFHAMHHELAVPYAFGAQYVNPADAFMGEILGGLFSTAIPGMSPRMAAVFISMLTIKALDDHCGMWFPNHPIHRWMSNNATFHAVHHQHAGIKSNYSMHCLATWDFLLGTYLPYSVEPRKEGGYQLEIAKEK